MNIFVLDEHPKKCAEFHCDKHVVKMILEYTLMLNYAQELCGGSVPPEFKTYSGYKNHPASKWARENLANYLWLLMLATALAEEYQFRYDRKHAWHDLIINHLPNVPMDLEVTRELTPRPVLMPDDCKCSNPILSYRLYYLTHKSRFATWNRGRPAPDWWKFRNIWNGK